MSGIRPAITDVLTQLATIQAQNQDLLTVPIYTRIFNNQPKRQLSGKIQAYPLPAAFVEIVKPTKFNRLLNGVSESDLIVRVYLQHWFIDAEDGTFDQDLPIFDLRDSVIATLSNYKPTSCGNLMLTYEGQDFNHDDIYVYLIEFTCSFIDSKGSPYDTGRTDYQNSIPPTGLDLTINSVETLLEPDFALGYYVITASQGTGNTWQFTGLVGKSGYAIYSIQLNQFLSTEEGVDVSYNATDGSFTILIPDFELVPGYGLIVFSNKYDNSLPSA